MIGWTYLERGRPVTVLVRWGPGGGPRNVLVRRADGELVVRPFRGLRRVPPSAPAGLARSAETARSGVRGAGGGSGAAEGRTAAHDDGEVES